MIRILAIKERLETSRFVKGIEDGVEASNTVNEHVPTLLTEQRVADINSILSMISARQDSLSRGSLFLIARQDHHSNGD